MFRIDCQPYYCLLATANGSHLRRYLRISDSRLSSCLEGEWNKIGRKNVLAGALRMSGIRNIPDLVPNRREIVGEIRFCSPVSNAEDSLRIPLQLARRMKSPTRLGNVLVGGIINAGPHPRAGSWHVPWRVLFVEFSYSRTRIRVLTPLIVGRKRLFVLVRDYRLFAGKTGSPQSPLRNMSTTSPSQRKALKPDTSLPDS